MSRNARTDENGENSPNFDEYVSTKKRCALTVTILTNNRQIVKKVLNETSKGPF